MRIQRGYRGSGHPPPLKNHKNIGFLSNSGLDPLKYTKLPSQHSLSGHHQHASETPFKWRFAGGSMMARLKCYLDPPTPHQLKKKQKKPRQNWTPSDKTVWIRAWKTKCTSILHPLNPVPGVLDFCTFH